MTSFRSSTIANFFLLSVIEADVSLFKLVVSDFLVESDGMDENTFYCSALKTKLV